MTDTTVIERPETLPAHFEPGDHDKFAHYALTADLTRAVIEGGEVTALCGKKWNPKHHFPEGFDVCPTCKGIYDQVAG